MNIIFIFSCFGMFRDVPACSGMFRHVPECSGMFHVPGFIDAPNFVRVGACGNNKNNPIDQLTFFLGAGKFPTKDQT